MSHLLFLPIVTAGPVAARPSFVVRAEEGEKAAPAKKPEIGPKRGTKVCFLRFSVRRGFPFFSVLFLSLVHFIFISLLLISLFLFVLPFSLRATIFSFVVFRHGKRRGRVLVVRTALYWQGVIPV